MYAGSWGSTPKAGRLRLKNVAGAPPPDPRWGPASDSVQDTVCGVHRSLRPIGVWGGAPAGLGERESLGTFLQQSRPGFGEKPQPPRLPCPPPSPFWLRHCSWSFMGHHGTRGQPQCLFRLLHQWCTGHAYRQTAPTGIGVTSAKSALNAHKVNPLP